MRLFGCAIVLALAAAGVSAESVDDRPVPSIETFTESFTQHQGYFDLWWDARAGKVWMRVDRFDEPLLYVTALASGVGSNDIGLDRGRLGKSRIVQFRRTGNRVLLVEPNLDFRADSDNPGERRAVRDAFAESVLAGLPIGAISGDRVLVDLSPLVAADAMGIPPWLKTLEQGDYRFDQDRSGILATSVRAFPKNVVVEALVTFSGSEPGAALEDVVPTPAHVTVRQRHNFVALPSEPMTPREFHPRSGFFYRSYRDYAAPLGSDMERRLIVRHRLRPGDPLVYYVDSGAPEPVRSALVEGASWWAEAFAAAGLPDVFRVEVLPPDADPLDIRYNVIQWVHRSTRGWSYGSSVTDPRTGEILKGHVTLGSLRVRQDMLIAEGLTAPFTDATQTDEVVRDMALARLRQLSAHEVGHTLGLAHNFAASAQGDASVMDYPHPNVRLSDGRVVLDDAYSAGVGAWDKLAIRYGYTIFDDEAAEVSGLRAVLAEAAAEGLRYVTDDDSRLPTSGHPAAHLWDNGDDPVARLNEVMAIRRVALDRFSEAVIPEDRPQSTLERALVPVFLLHRYQMEAVAHLIGGRDYRYSMRGDDLPPAKVVDDRNQRAALQALLATITPEALRLSSELAELIPPPAYGYPRDRETFTHATGFDFDALAPARAAATLTVALLLEPARVARLAEQGSGDASALDAMTVLGELVNAAGAPDVDQRDADGAIFRVVTWAVAGELMRLVANDSAAPTVRSLARHHLLELHNELPQGRPSKRSFGFGRFLAARIDWFLEDPVARAPAAHDAIPPGSPI